MWCTLCHTAFDYVTGKVFKDAARFHNPHYYDYMRTNGPELLRNLREEDLCGIRNNRISEWILPLLENTRHVSEVVIPRLNRRLVDTAKITAKSYDYLLGNVPKTNWERFITNSVKTNIVITAQLQICHLYTQSATSLLNENVSLKDVELFEKVITDAHVMAMKRIHCVTKLETLGIFFNRRV